MLRRDIRTAHIDGWVESHRQNEISRLKQISRDVSLGLREHGVDWNGRRDQINK